MPPLANRLSRRVSYADRLGAVVRKVRQLAVSLANGLTYASLERKVAERTRELEIANRRLEVLAATDALTGVANRRRLLEILELELLRSQRDASTTGVMMIDIDLFKLYNDRYGHIAGDACLRSVAMAVRDSIRASDVIARYGGEEFVVILPHTDLTDVNVIAERARTAVVALGETHAASSKGIVTVSIGTASSMAAAGTTPEQLLASADAELYRAKRGGRNQVRGNPFRHSTVDTQRRLDPVEQAQGAISPKEPDQHLPDGGAVRPRGRNILATFQHLGRFDERRSHRRTVSVAAPGHSGVRSPSASRATLTIERPAESTAGAVMDNWGMAGVWPGVDTEPFGELLRGLRLAAGMTQESLAHAARISVDAVGTLERGTRLTPRADTARLLADALGLDGEDRQRFLSVSAPHPRHPAPPCPARPVAGRSPPARSPLPLTSLVGREELVDYACRVVMAGPQRLVTLTGPGGVGKTRVAMAVAAAVPHIVGWVDLAALSDPANVRYAAAEAVGLVSDPSRSPVDALCQWAAKSRGLLVMDNCEHLLDAVADLVARMLAGPDGVRVLATSRERIGVPGERLIIVPPLRLPAAGCRDAGADALRLFADRAAQAAPGFALDDALVDRVTGVCRALDGLPLAIELAAARVGTLTIDDLACHLDAQFDLLAAARRGVDPRHHTLRAVMDWSYDLLSEAERLLFARLHVFAAEFDLAAAEAVATDERVPASRIAHLVALLADRSMLNRPGHAGVGRYRMLETLRTYAATRLSPEELIRVRRRHARYLVEMAEHADEELVGPDEAANAGRIEACLDDAWAAFSWAHDAGEVDLAVRLVAALARYAFWRMRPDVLAWGEWVVQAVPDHPRLPTAYAAAAAGAWLSGRLDEGQVLARRSFAAAGGPAAAAAPLELAVVCAFLAILKKADANDQTPVWPANNLRDAAPSDVSLIGGDLPEVLSAYRALTALAAPQTAGRAIGLANQAIALANGNDPAAWPTARQAVAHARASGNPTAIATARFAEGKAASDVDPVAALAALDEARAVAADVGCRLITAFALNLTVALRSRHGPPEEALALFHDAIRLLRATGHETLLVTLLSNLVILLARTGRDTEMVDLAATLRHATHTAIYDAEAKRIDTALSAARRALGTQRYRAAWSAGARRGVDEAAERAEQLLARHVTSTQPLTRPS